MAYLFKQPVKFTGAVLTPAQMAQADTLANDTERLMQAAGWAVARAIRQRFKPVSTLVLTGPGQNGGDGKVAAQTLARAGWPVRVKDFRDATIAESERAGLVVDAIFGAGLTRALDPHTADLLRAAKRLVAVDLPSGLDGATGQVRGFAPQALLTVTFVRKKPGHLLFPGRALCGELVLRDIGMAEEVIAQIAPQTWENSPALFTLPPRAATGHKYSHGNLTILCGRMPGAARLAGMAARRAGAGMVSLHAAQPMMLPEAGLIIRPEPLGQLLEDARRTDWVIGPGLGVEAASEALATLRARPGLRILADADALTACAGHPEALRGVRVITPHEGEFTRLFGPPAPDKLSAARRAATQIDAVVVLKGADTVIAAPEGQAAINSNAPPWLATAGTGDVLAGMIAAFMAQGLAPFCAACAGVWHHAEAARRVGPTMLAEDLPSAINLLRTQDFITNQGISRP